MEDFSCEMTYPDRSSHVRHGGEQVVVLPEDLPDLLLLFGGVIALRCNGGGEKSLQIADPLGFAPLSHGSMGWEGKKRGKRTLVQWIGDHPLMTSEMEGAGRVT